MFVPINHRLPLLCVDINSNAPGDQKVDFALNLQPLNQTLPLKSHCLFFPFGACHFFPSLLALCTIFFHDTERLNAKSTVLCILAFHLYTVWFVIALINCCPAISLLAFYSLQLP